MDDKTKEAEIRALARHASRKNIDTDGTLASGLDNNNTNKKKSSSTPKKEVKLAGWKHFLAGGVAGAAEVLATQPLDAIKTQLQMNRTKYTGLVDCAQKIVRVSGVKGLYYGMTPFMIQTSGKAAIRFTAFAKIKDGLEVVLGKQNAGTINMISGLMAGAVEAAVWTTPTERLKILRMTEVGGGDKYSNIFKATSTVIREQGIVGLFVGVIPTSLRQASSVGVRFALYPFVKAAFPEEGGTLTHMAAGGTVGGLSVILNNPIDAMKSIMQSGRLNAQGKPIGMVEAGKLIVQESGWLGFGRGLTARVPRVFCGQAITFAVYEKMAELLVKV
jgi:solute carrier family 25 citrate transporter 1